MGPYKRDKLWTTPFKKNVIFDWKWLEKEARNETFKVHEMEQLY